MRKEICGKECGAGFGKTLAWIEIAIGALFLASVGSDIQLGFGIVLISVGLNKLTK